MRVLCRFVEFKESKYSKDSELDYLHPVSLRYRVQGTVKKDNFIKRGKITAEEILTLIKI